MYSGMLDNGDNYGGASNPIVVGGDPSMQLAGTSQMKKKNKFQSFLGGMQGGDGHSGGLAGGLSALSGSGGVAGAIGNVARFLL